MDEDDLSKNDFEWSGERKGKTAVTPKIHAEIHAHDVSQGVREDMLELIKSGKSVLVDEEGKPLTVK